MFKVYSNTKFPPYRAVFGTIEITAKATIQDFQQASCATINYV